MKLNQIHTAHNSSREIPKYIFTIFLIKFFFLFKHFFFYFLLKFPITPLLLLNCHFLLFSFKVLYYSSIIPQFSFSYIFTNFLIKNFFIPFFPLFSFKSSITP